MLVMGLTGKEYELRGWSVVLGRVFTKMRGGARATGSLPSLGRLRLLLCESVLRIGAPVDHRALRILFR